MEENNLQAQPSIVTEPKLTRPWLKIVLFVALGVILVGGLVFAALKIGVSTKPQERACTTEAKICPDGSAVGRTGPNCEFAPCPAPATKDETANWKTYTNTKYGYTLKYPQAWQVSSLPGTDVVTSHEPLFSSPCDYDRGQLCTSIFILAATYNQEAKIYEGDIVIEPKVDKVSNGVRLKLDTEDARGFEWWPSYGQGGKLQYVVTAVHKNNKYTIMFVEKKEGKDFTKGNDWESKGVLDQILSTFKFLDQSQADETANWKTYKNEKYGIEFKYPTPWIFSEGEALSLSLPDQTRNFIQINISNSVNAAEDESSLPQPGYASVVYQIGKLRENQKNFEDFVNFQIENPERGIPPAIKPQLIPITINGHKALRIKEATIGSFEREFYYVEQSPERYMTISIIWDKNVDKLTIDQILSTFKFLD